MAWLRCIPVLFIPPEFSWIAFLRVANGIISERAITHMLQQVAMTIRPASIRALRRGPMVTALDFWAGFVKNIKQNVYSSKNTYKNRLVIPVNVRLFVDSEIGRARVAEPDNQEGAACQSRPETCFVLPKRPHGKRRDQACPCPRGRPSRRFAATNTKDILKDTGSRSGPRQRLSSA